MPYNCSCANVVKLSGSIMVARLAHSAGVRQEPKPGSGQLPCYCVYITQGRSLQQTSCDCSVVGDRNESTLDIGMRIVLNVCLNIASSKILLVLCSVLAISDQQSVNCISQSANRIQAF